MNFPSRHPLNTVEQRPRSSIANADVILGLELTDFWGTVNAFRDSLVRTLAVADQAGHEADQHHRRRPVHEGQLPGLPAVSRRSTSRWPPMPRRRCRRSSRRASALITADRRTRVRRRAASGWPTQHAQGARARARRRGLRLGREPDQHGAADAPSCGRRSRTRTGRSSPRAAT